MRQRRSCDENARLNRLLTLASIVIMSLVITIYVNYIVPKTQPEKRQNSGLLCQKETVCFDRIYDKELLKEAVVLLNRGNYILKGEIKTKSLTISDIDGMFKKNLPKNNPNMQKYVRINYKIIENDKKKGIYAGYLLTSFMLNEKQVFKMEIAFNKLDKKEIEKRVNCTIKAFDG